MACYKQVQPAVQETKHSSASFRQWETVKLWHYEGSMSVSAWSHWWALLWLCSEPLDAVQQVLVAVVCSDQNLTF
jgi:hypothetical protein